MKRILLLFVISMTITTTIYAQIKVIAHRGFWDTEGSAQNSIAALVKTDSIGCYGSEFDVWLSADNNLVVNHDATYHFKRMEKTSSADLTKLKLKNGETMPSLREYLEKGSKLNTRLVLELKKHSSAKRETMAIEKIIAMVKELGLEKRMEYISFSLHAVKEFIRLAPQGTPVYYLEGNLTPAELKEIGCAGPDYHFSVFKKNPEWIKQCHELGMKVNTWTVNKKQDMEWLIEQKVDFITTDKPLLLQERNEPHGVGASLYLRHLTCTSKS